MVKSDDIEAAWRIEAVRRLEEIRSGSVKAIPWDMAESLIFDSVESPGPRATRLERATGPKRSRRS